MTFYKAVLFDRDTDAQHDLGVYEAKTSEEASKKASNDYRNLLLHLETHKLELAISETSESKTRPGKRLRRVDKTLTLLDDETQKTRTTKAKAKALMRYKDIV